MDKIVRHFIKAAFCMALVVSGLSACEEKCPDSPDNPASGEQETYAVGDYYSKYGVEGIVYSVDDEGKHGSLMSMVEWEEKWATADGFIEARYPEYGGYNWIVVTALENWEIRFPAFGKCNTLNTGTVLGWYLPSLDELTEIRTALVKDDFDKTNSLLSTKGGQKLCKAYYWSSTEYGPAGAYPVDFASNASFDDNTYDFYATGKNETYHVRASKRF